ncbi:MAG: Lcl C-terminal domain-containing protein [Planctomycetota bacterium]
MPARLQPALYGFCLIVLLQPGSLWGQETSALTIESAGSYGSGFNSNVTRGWEFSVDQTTAVTSLGVWDYKDDGLESEVPVGLWDTRGHLIASVVVPAGTEAKLVDGFRFMPIEREWLLKGEKFIIGSAITAGSKLRTVGGSSNLTFYTDRSIRWLGNRYVLNQKSLAFPETTSQSPGGHVIPAGFGPSLLLERAARPRRFYRNITIAKNPFKYSFVTPLEQADGKHKADPLIDLILFATQEGTLTQIVLDGRPVGAGTEAFTTLNDAIPRLITKWKSVLGVSPRYRIAALSWASQADVDQVTELCRSHNLLPQINLRADRDDGIVTFREVRPAVDNSPDDRFADRGDYVEDSWTGLLWQKHGTESDKLNFSQAADYARDLNLGGRFDWRVPRIEELATIFPATKAPFVDSRYTPERCCAPPHEYASYWTSETDKRPNVAFVYHWYDQGGANNCLANANYVYVRCVHDP